MNDQKNCVDIVIVGAGPAGLFSAFYCGMRQMSVKLIDSMPQLGGQLAALYPEKFIYDVAGFPKIKAQALIDRLIEQMHLFEPSVCLEEKVLHVDKIDERLFKVTTDKQSHYSRAVIITGGIGAFEPKRLELPEAAQYEGANLHYFVNDLNLFKDKHVLISGGGDSAVDWALMLEKIAAKVTLIHRRDRFRAHEHSVAQLKRSGVNVLTPYEIVQLHGDQAIAQVTLQKVKTNEKLVLDVDAVIVNFGFSSSLGPISEWGIAIEKGAIAVNSKMETSIPGIFAAGDMTTYPGKLKLIAVGFGEAPTAVNNAKVYIDPESRLSPGHSSHMKIG